MKDKQPVLAVPIHCDSGISFAWKVRSYRERPGDIRLVVHSYDRCKGSFHSRSTGAPYGYCAIATSTNGQPLPYLPLPTEPQEKRRCSHHAGRLTVFAELRKMIRPIDLTGSQLKILGLNLF